MNPFWWILWALAATVALFIIAAVLTVIFEKVRGAITTHRPCPRCGYQAGQDDTYVPPEWTQP